MMRFSPRYGAATLGEWVGFSDLCGLADEAVLRWFSEQGYPPGQLWRSHGARLSVADASVLATGRLRLDEESVAQVKPLGGRYYDVKLAAIDGDGTRDVMRGRFTVVLLTDRPGSSLPGDLAPLAVPEIAGLGTAVGSHESRFEEQALAEAVANGGPEGLRRSWRVPYSACGYSGYMRHSAYVRALEGLSEDFLAERQAAMGWLAAEYGWVPVFTRARLRLVGEARVDERLHGVYNAAQVVQGAMIDGRVDFYVFRQNVPVPTATGIFLHGFCAADDSTASRGAELPQALLAAVTEPSPGVVGAEGGRR